MINTDELKALRLRRTQLTAELARIDSILDEAMGEAYTGRPLNYNDQPTKLSTREQFYRDAENDFRNTDSNGNYVTPEDS